MRNGYVAVHRPGHPRAKSNGYVLEHLLIAERALGRPVPARYEVHHVNENPADNRPSNLVICEDKAYHKLLHRRRDALRACGNPNWVRCVVCRCWGPPEGMYSARASGSGSFHRDCRNQYDRRAREGKVA